MANYFDQFDAPASTAEKNFFDQFDGESARLRENEDERQQNLQNRNPVMRGVVSGVDTLQAMGGGALALAGRAVESEDLTRKGLDIYQRNMEEASLNPSAVDLEGLWSDPSLGKALEWGGHTLGTLLPSMAEAAGGAVLGSFAAPGPGTVAGVFLGRTILKKGIQKLAAEMAEEGIKKGLAREAAESLAEKAAAKVMLKSFGAKAGAVGATWQMEGGGNFGEAVDQVGLENTSVGSALATGAAAALLETAGGNIRVIDKILGSKVGQVAAEAVKHKRLGVVAQIFKEAATQAPAEAAQEMGQEFLSLVNLAVVDPQFQMMTRENVLRLVESGAAGALGGVAFGAGTGLAPWRSGMQDEPVAAPRSQASAAPPKPAGPLSKAVERVAPVAPAGVVIPEEPAVFSGMAPAAEFVPRTYVDGPRVQPDIERGGGSDGGVLDVREEVGGAAQEVSAVRQGDETQNSVEEVEAPDLLTAVDALAHEAATSPTNDVPEPTPAQVEAGNYKKGHVEVQGLDISIENPAGSVRKGTGSDGSEWQTEMANHYGYVKGMEGADKDHLDVFLGPNPETSTVAYVVDQRDPKTGVFDEHKVVLGAADMEEAKAVYRANYEPGWQGLGAVSAMPLAEFRAWGYSGGAKKGALVYGRKAEVELAAQVPEPVPGVPAGPLPQLLREALRFNAKTMKGLTANHLDGILATWEEPEARKIAAGIKQYRPDMAEEVDRLMVRYHPGPVVEEPAKAQAPEQAVSAVVVPPGQTERLNYPTLKRQAIAAGLTLSKKQPDGSFLIAGADGVETRVGDLSGVRDHLAGAGRMVLGNDQVAGAGKPMPVAPKAGAGRTGRAMDEDGRVSDGLGGIRPGDTFVTSGKRQTTPYPKTPNHKGGERAADQWLIDNALAEAEARGDKFNLTIFKGEGAGNLPSASKSAMTMYLFGEQPSVPRPFLKELGKDPVADKNTRKAESKPSVSAYGADNKLVTRDRAEELAAKLRQKAARLSSGVDPELLAMGTELAVYHIEAGARSFVKYSKALAEHLGDAAGRLAPYFKAWYMGAKNWPGMDKTGMDSEVVVDALEIDDIIQVTKEDSQTETQEGQDGQSAIAGNEGSEALEEVSATKNEGTEGAGTVRDGEPGSRKAGDGGNKRPAKARVSGARSRRGGAADVHSAEAGGLAEPSASNLPAVNFAITDEVQLGKGSEGVKFADNLAAIRALRAIERENRRATAGEQRLLARYVGWGGLSSAFADDKGEFKPGWETRGQELAGLLTEGELKAARRSTRNAHYTSEPIVRGMWKAVQAMGFSRGMVLEPSAGAGNFIGLAPAEMQGRFVAVEYDSLTARIAGALYPQATVLHSGFQKLSFPDNAFDLSIGNPPFGAESLQFQSKPSLNGHSIHNQFFLAGMDALKPGGIQAMVVSRYLLDAKDTGARMELAGKAKLLGAIRLPDTAFKENARTEVVTDIVFLQKLSVSDQAQMAEVLAAFRGGAKKDAVEERERRALAAQMPEWVQTTAIADPLGGEAMTVNGYFAQRPEMIIGTLERSGSMRHGADITVRFDKGGDFDAELSRRFELLPKNVMQAPTALEAIEKRFEDLSDSLRIALDGLEHGSIVFDRDGKLSEVIEREAPEGGYEFAKRELSPTAPWSDRLVMGADGKWYTLDEQLDEQGNKVKEVDAKGKPTRFNAKVRNVYESEADIPESMRLGASRFERLVELIKIRDLLRRQLVLETSDAPRAEMEGNRKKLNAAYDAFVAQHDFLNSPKNEGLISDMPDGALLVALELGYRPALSAIKAKRLGESPRPAEAKKAPILSERVVVPYDPPSKADSAADALVISMAESGRVDLDRLAALLSTDRDGVVAALHGEPAVPLIFRDPELNEWQSRDQYLSGQVKRKLAAAKAAGLEKNVAALEKVQPEPWGADQVTSVMGATWIPADVYEAFIEHLTGEKGRVSFSRATNAFDVTVPETAKGKDWGTEHAPIGYILKQALNSMSIRLTYRDSEGHTHFMPEETALAQVKANQVAVEFGDWVFAEGDRRRRLVELFNEKFNVRVQRQYDGQHLFLPGKVPDQIIQMRRHQKNAIWRGIQERFLLLDHVVGAGKTFTAIARAMERRRMGLSRKPMIVVPNHMVEQFAADVYRLYPGAKMLAAGKKDFDSKNRRRLFAKIATGDWDVVVVPHSSFKFISISTEAEERYLEEEIRIAKEAIREAEQEAAEQGLDTGWRKPWNVKQAEALAEKLENKMAKLKGKTADRLLTFEQLGVDDLTLDEGHEFKNLFYSSRLTGVRGMGDRAGSEKAYDLYQKVRVLRDSPTGSVVFMTGTPISNSAVEMYTMMRYLAGDELRDLGLEHFDAWRAQFVDAATAWEPTESGRLKEVTRLGRSWSNMRSLMDLYYSFTDAVPLEDIKTWYEEDNEGRQFPVPRVKGGDRTKVVVPPTEAQTEQLSAILAGFDGLEGIKNPNERNAERLRLMDRARKVSLDARAVNPRLETTEKGGKLEAVSREVKRLYDQWNADKGTQLVFLDRSVPKSRGDDRVLKEYDKTLAERDAAMARDDERSYMAAVEKLERYDENEITELRQAQAGGWNAYQQIKDNLVQLGIPEKEIRFVQEASTDEQKQALFDAVNAGEVRVMIGSTPRMGAGTNVQQRLVGLHHVDVTWKPSDIEQREGRIIRQGNRLLEKYGIEGFEVEILAYATERTVDAKMWDLNATKLRTINGIRKYSGEFTMDFEDEESVGMAEIAALASGDPLLLERVKLDSEIGRLEMLRRGWNRQVMALRDRVDDTEKDLRLLPAQVERRKAAAEVLAAALREVETLAAERTLTVEGVSYGKRMEAHRAIEAAVTAQQAGDEKARYAVEVGGEKLTSKAALEKALEEGLGDAVPFRMRVGGEDFIHRGGVARALTKNANELAASLGIRDSKTERVGEWLGYGLDLDVEERFGGLHATLSLVDARGGSVESVSGGVSSAKKGDQAHFSQQYLRALLTAFESAVTKAASPAAYVALERRLATAKRELPELQAQMEGKGEFPQRQELTQKQERLEEVVRTLSAKKAPAAAEEFEIDGAEAPKFSLRPSVQEQSRKFAQQVEQFLAREIPREQPLVVGHTPKVLRALGAEDLPVVVTQRTLAKIVEGKHGIPVDMVKTLPRLLDDPLMVFDSATDGGLVVLTDQSFNGAPVVVAIHLTVEEQRYQVNRVASIYGKDRAGWVREQIEAGRLRYVKNREVLAGHVTGGLQLPKVSGALQGLSAGIILSKADLVKFSQDGKQLSGVVALSDVEFDAIFKRITARMKNTDGFIVAPTARALPPRILAEIKKQGNEPEQIDGVFHDGKVYLVRENIASAERLEEVLFHEWYGHAGFYAMFGNDGQRLKSEMAKLYDLVTPKRLFPLGRRHGVSLLPYGHALARAGYDIETRKAIIMEEMLAHLAQEYNRGTIANRVREIVGRIRAWLREHGFVKLAAWSDADIAWLLKRARFYAEEGAWVKGNDPVAINGHAILQRLRETGVSDEMLEKFLAGTARFSAGRNEPTVFGKTGSKVFDRITVNGSEDLWTIPAEVEKRTGGRFPSAPVRLLNGRHFGDHRGFGVAHIEAGHGDELAALGMTAAEYVYSILSRVSEVRDAGDPKVLYVFTGGMPKGGAALELRLYDGGFYSVRTAFDMKAVGKIVWSGRTASPGVEKNPYTGVSRQSLPKDVTTSSSSAEESARTDHGPGANAPPAPALEGLADQTDIIIDKDGGEVKFSIRDQVQAAEDKAAALNTFLKKIDAEALKIVFGNPSEWVPERVKYGIGTVLSNPHYGAKKSEGRQTLYDLNLERSANANEMKYDIMATQDNYEGLEGVLHYWRESGRDGQALIKKLVIEGTIDRKVYSEADLDSKNNPTGVVVPDAARKAYFAIRQTIERANEVRIERMGRLRLIPFEGTEYYQELIDLLDENLLPDKVRQRFGIHQQAVDAYLEIRKSRTKLDAVTKPYKDMGWYSTLRDVLLMGLNGIEMLQEFSTAPELLDAWRAIRKDFKGEFATAEKHKKAQWYKILTDLLTVGDDHPMLQKLELYNAYLGAKEFDSQLAKMKSDWAELPGYFPLVRNDGEWHVRIRQVSEGGTFKTVFMKTAKTKTGARLLEKDVRENMKAHIPRNFNPKAKYVVTIDRNKALPEEVFAALGPQRAMEALITKAINKATDSGIVENPLGLQRQILEEMSNQISARGFGRHSLHRSEELIEGFEEENVPALLEQFVAGEAGWLSKAEFAMRANKAVSEIPEDAPDDIRWAEDYAKDALKNATYVDQIAGTARSIITLMYLGFKISTVVLNGTQNYVYGQAVLSKYTKGATQRLVRAQFEVVRDRLRGKAGMESLLSEDDRWALDEGLRRGSTHANLVRAMSGADDTGGVMGSFQSSVRWMTDKAMAPFQAVETYWNREPMLLAAFRVFREQGMEKFEALKKAEGVVNDAHFVMGKENIPTLLRKMGPFGRSIYTFQGFTHNYLLGMLTSLSQGEFAVVARSLTALVLFGGLAAVPFGDDLDKWYRKMFGERPLRMLDKWLRATAHQYTDHGDQIADFVMHGAPALAGVNFSNAIAVNIPWLSPEDESLAERVMGVWGGLAQKVVYAGESMAKGDAYRAAEFMSPEALANILRAYRLHNVGTTTLSGRPVFGDNGQQVKYTAKDALMRAFGFMPLEPSKQSQGRWDARRAKDYWQERKSDVLARYRTAKDRHGALKEVHQFNRELRNSTGVALVPVIDGKTLRQALKAKPDRREMNYLQ